MKAQIKKWCKWATGVKAKKALNKLAKNKGWKYLNALPRITSSNVGSPVIV
jgi:hypothetical protein